METDANRLSTFGNGTRRSRHRGIMGVLWAAALGAGMLGASRQACADEGATGLSLTPAWYGGNPDAGQTPDQIHDRSVSDPPAFIDQHAVALLDASGGAGSVAENPFKLTLELPIWLSGMNGTIGVGGFKVPANASFDQILQATDSLVGLGGRVEADYGNWIFYIDGLYMKLAKDNISVGPASVNFITELSIANAGIMYQVGNWNLGSNEAAFNPALSLAGGVGARYMHVGVKLNTVNGASRNQNEDWADPVVVGQAILNLDKHWQILARGDIGGGSADFTWSATMYFGYRFLITDKVSGAVRLGYTAVGEDYSNGEGIQQFTWDVILHGPVIDLVIAF